MAFFPEKVLPLQAESIYTVVENMEKNYRLPPIVWLRMTDYMHGWLDYELGGGARVAGRRVLSVQDIPGAREVFRMESVEDVAMESAKVGNSMSGNRRDCLSAGLELDAEYILREFGMTKDQMDLFVPIECPRRCMTEGGVLRRWTLDVNLGREQASAMQRLLRGAFWRAVEEFNTAYAGKMNGEKYPAVDMIEAFCARTKTPDLYVEAMRREWQRRVKRGDSRDIKPERKVVHVTMDEVV